VRFLSGVLVLAVSVSVARAQEQEHKLLDRLLRPNSALQNAAQNKTFVAGGASSGTAVVANSFYIPPNALSKSYSAEREFSAREFMARHFRDGDVTAPARPRVALMERDYPIYAANIIRDASEKGRTTSVGQFQGTRSFLDRGKSQKSLSTQNPPMTIEQVRELLNKNK
jgi:hypothetical protein